VKRLRTRPDYLAVAKGVRVVRPGFVLQARPRKERAGEPRFGFTASRKTGTAVVRNRIRRRLKELARAGAPSAPEGIDFVLIGRREAAGRDFATMAGELQSAFADASRSRRQRRPEAN